MRKIVIAIVFLLIASMLLPLSSLAVSSFTVVPNAGARFSNNVAREISGTFVQSAITQNAPHITSNKILGTQSSSSATNSRNFGFWLQEDDLIASYSPQQFFDQYFLTAPFPSSLEVMIFGPIQGTSQISMNYWTAVASFADSYPNIRIEYMIAFDMSSTSQWTLFQNYVNALGGHHSTYSVGVEGEYSGGQSPANMLKALQVVNFAGKLFISYYVASFMIPAGGYLIGHTNFPGGSGSYDQVHTLTLFQSNPYVGMSSGYYASFVFPGSLTCPVGSDALSKSTSGWNQCMVDTEISTALGVSAQYRQFLNFAVGFPLSGTFKDTAGIATTQLWDSPVLRSWIWNDPQYQSNFVLAISGSQPPTPPPGPQPPPSNNGASCTLSTSSALINGIIHVSCVGLPHSSTLKVVIYNNLGKIVATLNPGTTGSGGHITFPFRVQSSMSGADSISIFSPSGSSTPLISGLQFTIL